MINVLVLMTFHTASAIVDYFPPGRRHMNVLVEK